MKKTVTLGLLALSIGGAMPAGLVGAETVNNANMTTTIDNSQGTTDTSGKIKVNGSLGFDPSDPNSPEPLNPNEWLKVTFPTEVVFRSSKDDNHSSIISPKYEIKNDSGRPVKVDVKSYSVTDGKALKLMDNLNLKTPNGQVPLITKSNYGAMGELMRLDITGQTGLYGGDKQAFEFVGNTNKTNFLQTDKVTKLDSTIELNFTPLRQDGTDYPVH